MDGTMMPPAGVHPGPNPAIKWFLFILFGLIFVIGVIIAGYYLSRTDTMGVTVIRMEGTMVTGLGSDTDIIGSEVVGGELRDAADDPMIEAIVLRVNSPGGTPAAAQEIIRDLDYARSKKAGGCVDGGPGNIGSVLRECPRRQDLREPRYLYRGSGSDMDVFGCQPL
jgi:hypothetical protein